jgi:Flp pilus assembly protein TadG
MLMACFRRLPALLGATNGTAAIEFAIAAPFLLLLLAGVASLGAGLRAKMEVGNAARAGAQYAALHGFSQSGISSAASNATYLSNVTVTSTETTPGCTSTTGGVASAGSATSCPNGGPTGTYVTVVAQTTYTSILPVLGLASSMSLQAVAVARLQ